MPFRWAQVPWYTQNFKSVTWHSVSESMNYYATQQLSHDPTRHFPLPLVPGKAVNRHHSTQQRNWLLMKVASGQLILHHFFLLSSVTQN
jgi:hypothetical protein